MSSDDSSTPVVLDTSAVAFGDEVRGDLPRATFESLASGVVIQEPGGRIVDANRAACVILGMTWDQMQGRTSADPRWRSVHEDGSNFPGATHPAMVSLASGEPVRDVVMGVHKADGALTWILINSEPIRGADSRATGSVVTTFTDISEQVRLRAELADSERRYRLLAENSADVVVLVEGETYTWVSPSVTQALGWSPADLVGHDRAEFLHPDDRAAMAAEAAVMHPGVPDRARRRVRARDGRYHWVDVQARVDPSAAGSGSKVLALRVVDAEVLAREVEHRASHDELTGALNRAEAYERLARMLGDSAALGHGTGVVFCDVDDFKDINDTFGHLAGDAVLRTVAERLRAHVRRGDGVARVGGDELLVLLRHVPDLVTATTLAEELLDDVVKPVEVGGDTIPVSMSAGVTVSVVADSVDDVVERADRAMYDAKRAGKSRVVALAP